MSYFPKPSLNENDLAIIERGDTAAHSIDAGQYVSWHGRTGKAKAAILQGATLSDSLFDYDEDGVLSVFVPILSNELEYVNLNNLNIPVGSSYTCPRTGIYIFAIKGGNNAAGHMFLDSARTRHLAGNQNLDGDIFACIPLKAGTTVYTRANAGVYAVLGYYKI